METFSDHDIIKNIINGDTNQFSLLVEKHQQKIFSICIGYIHDEDDANDLTQETFINAYQNLSKFQFKSSFSTWLYRIAINVSLNYLRKRKPSFFERIDEIKNKSSETRCFSPEATKNPENILLNEEFSNIITKELNRLSDKQKTAFILSKYDNLPQKEIAEIMKTTEGAVESLIQRAKSNLQKRLSKYLKK